MVSFWALMILLTNTNGQGMKQTGISVIKGETRGQSGTASRYCGSTESLTQTLCGSILGQGG